MSTRTLSKVRELLPSTFDDFFKPWNEWFNNNELLNKGFTIPAVNVTEETNSYNMTVAAPGMAKEDFSVDIDGNLLTISAEKKDEKENKEKTYTRKEYNYSSFSRSFNLPDEVIKEKIEAKYNDGILSIMLPKKEGSKSGSGQKVKID